MNYYYDLYFGIVEYVFRRKIIKILPHRAEKTKKKKQQNQPIPQQLVYKHCCRKFENFLLAVISFGKKCRTYLISPLLRL